MGGGDVYTQGDSRKEAMWRKQRLELLPQVKEFLGLPEGGRGKEGSILILDF